MKYLVTGGAGFIGRHLVAMLIHRGAGVRVVDDFSQANGTGLPKRAKILQGDLRDHRVAIRAVRGTSVVIHLAANVEVRTGAEKPSSDFTRNLLATFKLLEAMRRSPSCKRIVFASSSTIYGEPTDFPTPETYGPLAPISVYGATKLGCEALISAYCHTFGLSGRVLRFANVVGTGMRHGVIWDFLKRLTANPRELKILGDGSQRKSYLYIDDCISAFALCTRLPMVSGQVEIYNVGTRDQVSILKVAQAVAQDLALRGVKIRCTGGVLGGRGWPGDVKEMLLDPSRFERLGWKARYSSQEAVRLAAKALAREGRYPMSQKVLLLVPRAAKLF